MSTKMEMVHQNYEPFTAACVLAAHVPGFFFSFLYAESFFFGAVFFFFSERTLDPPPPCCDVWSNIKISNKTN